MMKTQICELSNSIKLSGIIPNENVPIYHYTSPGGFKGIIENKTLRFTNRYFLNDYSEGVYVLDLCIKYIDKLALENKRLKKIFYEECIERKNAPQNNCLCIYQCSFSADKDSLCLWNYYTKGDNIQGYNLCFNSEKISEQLKLTSNMDDNSVPPFYCGKIIYKENEQLEIIKSVINKFLELIKDADYQHEPTVSRMIIDKLMLIGIFFKKSCFDVEKEYRVAVSLSKYFNDGSFYAIKEQQKCYEKSGILIPFVDIAFEPEGLIKIGISPTLDFITTKNSIDAVTLKDFPQIQKDNAVNKSEIPVRY